MTDRKKSVTGFQEGRGYSKQDWDAVDSPELTDKEMARAIPAKDVLPSAFFKAIKDERRARGRPRIARPKEAVTIRLDPDVVERFRATGKDWRKKMAEVLAKSGV